MIFVQSDAFGDVVRSWHWRLMGTEVTAEELALYRENLQRLKLNMGRSKR